MAGPWDHFFKKLVGQCPAQYVKWVEEEAQFIGERNIELKIKHRYADALLEVVLKNQKALLHFEFQVAKDDDMPERMHEYNVMAGRQYELPVYSYVVYLRNHRKLPRSPYIKRFVDGKQTHRFYYKVIKLWEVPAEQILAMGWKGLLPLIPLAKGGKKPEFVKVMIDTLAQQKEWELLASAYLLGSLVFKKKSSEQMWFQRRFEMYQDVLEETWAYQLIGEKYHEKGLQEGMQKALQKARQTFIGAVQIRFPEIVPLVKSQVELIQDQEVLSDLTLKVVGAQTSEEILQCLVDLPEGASKR